MAERQTKADMALTAPPVNGGTGLGRTELIAVVGSVVWVLVIGIFALSTPEAGDSAASLDRLRSVIALIAVVLPVAMIWLAVSASRSAKILREDTRKLRASIDALRQASVIEPQAPSPTVERKLEEIVQATRKTESALATFTSSRDIARGQPPRAIAAAPKPAEEQPLLALGTPIDEIGPPLARADLIRALHFPDTDKDEEGFAALRRALRDRQARQLVQASQDVLTLLSQDGIYMDDLRPDRARPEIWRRFANGERGRAVAALGGVRDRSCLTLTTGRMREDTIFRDAAHHFLRRFDQMLLSFEPDATDEEVAAMSETRTARAFMLLGRVTGAFD